GAQRAAGQTGFSRRPDGRGRRQRSGFDACQRAPSQRVESVSELALEPRWTDGVSETHQRKFFARRHTQRGHCRSRAVARSQEAILIYRLGRAQKENQRVRALARIVGEKKCALSPVCKRSAFVRRQSHSTTSIFDFSNQLFLQLSATTRSIAPGQRGLKLCTEGAAHEVGPTWL